MRPDVQICDAAVVAFVDKLANARSDRSPKRPIIDVISGPDMVRFGSIDPGTLEYGVWRSEGTGHPGMSVILSLTTLAGGVEST